VWLRVRVTNS